MRPGPRRSDASDGGRGGGGGGAGGGGRGGAGRSARGGRQWLQDFYGVAGGESGYISSSPIDPDIMYGANYGGMLAMRDRNTGRGMSLDIWPLNPMGHDATDSKYRFQWTYPIVHSPHDAAHDLRGLERGVSQSTDERQELGTRSRPT